MGADCRHRSDGVECIGCRFEMPAEDFALNSRGLPSRECLDCAAVSVMIAVQATIWSAWIDRKGLLGHAFAVGHRVGEEAGGPRWRAAQRWGTVATLTL